LQNSSVRSGIFVETKTNKIFSPSGAAYSIFVGVHASACPPPKQAKA
jgi:hypothetical protein